MASRIIDLIGLRFGKLVVIAGSGSRQGNALWRCQCDCGKTTVTAACHLKSGHTQSCGCLHAEIISALLIRHGESIGRKLSPEYVSWRAMKLRCLNPGDAKYPSYGGRGITICERWMDFTNFLADMGRKPSPKLTLDRINNDGNYEPGNCRWATPTEQARNRRRPKLK